MEFVECEVWILVDSDGGYTLAHEVGELESDGIGLVSRTVKVTVRVPKPKAAEVTVTVGEEPGDVTAAA